MSLYITNGFIFGRLQAAARKASDENAEAISSIKAFRHMEEEFFEKVHPFTDVGLAISEVLRARGGTPNIFTVHGSRHISDLIKNLDKFASEIQNTQRNSSLDVHEAYILLCAAHVHDAANVSGREDHPSRCNEIIERHKSLFTSPIDRQHIYEVASVHGGEHPQFKKDTLRGLDLDNSTSPRLPLLAAMLRLADELSENAERVPEIVLDKHGHSGYSKLAHAYAKSFVTFNLRKETLYIVYNVYPSQRDFVADVSGGSQSFLQYLEHKIDVIESESRYCSQYGRPVFDIRQIQFTINEYANECPSPVKSKLDFTLQLAHGYPESTKSLCERSKQLNDRNVRHLAECFART